MEKVEKVENGSKGHCRQARALTRNPLINYQRVVMYQSKVLRYQRKVLRYQRKVVLRYE